VETLKPASIVVGDNPGLFNYGANEQTFMETGLTDAALGHYNNIGNDAQAVDSIPAFVPKVSVSRNRTGSRRLLLASRNSKHTVTVMTGGHQELLRFFLPGAQKAKLHRAAGNPERFHEMLMTYSG